MSKQLTAAQKKILKGWEGGFSEEEIHDGFEIEVGFFGSFPFLVRNDNGKFESIVTGTGEIDNEFGDSIDFVPLYTFGSTKLAQGVVDGKSLEDWDNFTEKEQASAAATYGSLKKGSDNYSLGSFEGNEDYERIINSTDLGSMLRKRFYICGLMPKFYGENPVMLTFGITASKTWSSYVNLLRSHKWTPAAIVTRIKLVKEQHKTKKKINFFRPHFEVLMKNGMPVFSAENHQAVRDELFPIRDEIKARHQALVKSMDQRTEEPTE